MKKKVKVRYLGIPCNVEIECQGFKKGIGVKAKQKNRGKKCVHYFSTLSSHTGPASHDYCPQWTKWGSFGFTHVKCFIFKPWQNNNGYKNVNSHGFKNNSLGSVSRVVHPTQKKLLCQVCEGSGNYCFWKQTPILFSWPCRPKNHPP